MLIIQPFISVYWYSNQIGKSKRMWNQSSWFIRRNNKKRIFRNCNNSKCELWRQKYRKSVYCTFTKIKWINGIFHYVGCFSMTKKVQLRWLLASHVRETKLKRKRDREIWEHFWFVNLPDIIATFHDKFYWYLHIITWNCFDLCINYCWTFSGDEVEKQSSKNCLC